MPEDMANHWQSVYRTKQPDQVSWYASHLNVSLELLKQAGLNSESRIIDIGAGASTLVDDLLDMGLRQIMLVDISAAALDVARRRLGVRAASVQWLVADAGHMDLPPLSYDLWHDRAALHFLVDAADAAAYVASATRAIANGGFAVVGGFAADGPERCSGLPVVRREPEDIAKLFGDAFTLVQSRHEKHLTPWSTPQSFSYALLRKSGKT
jgi:ubiquinone/menaquinone biosynthesis C-methylase UbiE